MVTHSSYYALIPCAGVGQRVGAYKGTQQPKQYIEIAGHAIVWHTLQAFISHPQIVQVFVVIAQNDERARDILGKLDKVSLLQVGGQTRRDSVLNGLKAMQRHGVSTKDWVLVHDAARPGITPELISNLIQAVPNTSAGGLLALPIVDTLKREGQGIAAHHAASTVARKGLWAAQTPQMFRLGLLQKGLQAVATVTDEASAIEVLGHTPKLVQGHLRNFKVTLPADIELAELFLQQPTKEK